MHVSTYYLKKIKLNKHSIILHKNYKNLNINNTLPLLICDADEVLFEFMKSFEIYLSENNMHFTYKSFKLSGNIINLDGNKIIDSNQIPKIISDFFKCYTSKMPLIKGAKDTLKILKKYVNIVILSNIPEESANDRIKLLKKNEMDYDFICNKGPKGEICKELEKLTDKKIFFIDDLPNQIESVKKYTKNIITIHFLQNKKLLKIIPKVKNSDFNTNNWEDVKRIILNNI